MAFLAALGDSITYGSVATWNGGGWTYTRAATPYPAAVQAAIGVEVTNHGVPGDTTSRMLARYASDVRPDAPRWVVILGGTNDLTASTSAATIEANLNSIIAAVQVDGAEPVLVTILPRGGTGPHGSDGNLPGGNAELLAVNAWIRARGLRYVDAFALFDDGSNRMQLAYDSGDGVHLNQAGDYRLAAGVLDAIGTLNLTAAPLDGAASLVPPSFTMAAGAGLTGGAVLSAPGHAIRLDAAPLASSAALSSPASALQQAASLGGGATVPGPALTLQQAANIAAEAGFAGGDFAMQLEAAPLDGAMSMPGPRQAFHLGILRRAALGSQQRRPWRIYDGKAWAEHRPRQFNGSTF